MRYGLLDGFLAYVRVLGPTRVKLWDGVERACVESRAGAPGADNQASVLTQIFNAEFC